MSLSRRKFIQKAAYTAPVILSLKAMPSFASGGSAYNGGYGSGEYPSHTGHYGSSSSGHGSYGSSSGDSGGSDYTKWTKKSW